MRNLKLKSILAACVLLLSGGLSNGQATQPSDVKVRVQSVRVGRSNQELQGKFRNRGFPNETQTGVSIQLVVETDKVIEPEPQESLNIETFIDDTYLNLLSGRENESYGNRIMRSDDGKTLVFGISTNKPPAIEAERIFVRGTLRGRIPTGDAIVTAVEIDNKVGTSVTVGNYKVVVLESGGSERGAVRYQLSGPDLINIKSIRVLNKAKKELVDNIKRNIQEDNVRAQTLYAQLPVSDDPVTLEFSVVEKFESVSIPFETQIDVGNATAGPIEKIQPKGTKGKDGKSKPWPPPPIEKTDFPDRRSSPMFARATTGPATQPSTVKDASVDLFSLAIGKPTPAESKDSVWKNNPSTMFRAAGFTLLRLMVSVPEDRIINIPITGLSVTEFVDDTGKQLDTAIYRSPNDSRYSQAQVSTEGNQALVTIPLVSTPTVGASKFTAKGSVKVLVAKNFQTKASEVVTLEKGQIVKIGPYTLNVMNVYLPPALTPDPNFSSQPLSTHIQIDGPMENFRRIEMLGENGQQLAPGSSPDYERSVPGMTTNQFTLSSVAKVEKVKFRVTFHEGTREAEIPFEVTSGVGF